MIPPRTHSIRLWPGISVIVALCMGMTAPPAQAIKINGEGPDLLPGDTGIYDRFVIGTYPGAPVANPTFIGASFNLSGVGWNAANATHSITLVSPSYFVAASHLLPGIGGTLRFVGTDNALHSATVDSYHTLIYTGTSGPQSSDLTLGRLTTSLPPAVTPMPVFYAGETDILTPSSFDAYDGVSLFNYGRTARMGTNGLDGFTEFTFGGPQTNIGLYYTQGPGAGETLLEGGDSGSPTIAYRNGVYGLIGTHSGVDAEQSLSVDAFVSYTSYVDQMNAIMAADSQSLTLVGTPEPGTLMFGVALLGICAARRMRGARQTC